MEEQLSALRQSLQDQTSAAHSLTSGLEAQLENMQKQVAQVTAHEPIRFNLIFRLNGRFVSQSQMDVCDGSRVCNQTEPVFSL